MPNVRVTAHRRTPINSDGSSTYLLRWRDPGDGKRRTETCLRSGPNEGKIERRRNMAEARRLAYAKRREFCADGTREKHLPITIRQALDRFVEWCGLTNSRDIPNAAPGTVENRIAHIEEFLAWLKLQRQARYRMAIHHIIRADIAGYRDHLLYKRKLQESTVNCQLASLGAWFTWAWDHGHIPANPAREVIRANAKGRKRAVLSVPDGLALKRLMTKLANDYQRDVILFLAHTGLRCNELKSIQLEDVDLDSGVLHVVETGTERTKLHGRTIPLTPQAWAAARRLIAQSIGPYFIGVDFGQKRLSCQVNKWLRATGLGVTPHHLRRLFQTALETVGSPRDTVDDLMAHSPGKTRKAYTPNSNLERDRPWVEKLGRFLAISPEKTCPDACPAIP